MLEKYVTDIKNHCHLRSISFERCCCFEGRLNLLVNVKIAWPCTFDMPHHEDTLCSMSLVYADKFWMAALIHRRYTTSSDHYQLFRLMKISWTNSLIEQQTRRHYGWLCDTAARWHSATQVVVSTAVWQKIEKMVGWLGLSTLGNGVSIRAGVENNYRSNLWHCSSVDPFMMN